MDDYLKDPAAIEARSFAMIREQTDLSRFDDDQQQVVLRLVQTCANPAIAGAVRFSAGAMSAGLAALAAGAPVLCDVEMVRQGLAKRHLTVEPQCFLNAVGVAEAAARDGISRTMTAVNRWTPYLAGSIAVIGNAPTALYRLMELLEAGAATPRLVIGMPVGFVGAPEAKDYLWTHHEALGVDCMTLLGRSGGSALAAGAFNALARLRHGQRD